MTENRISIFQQECHGIEQWRVMRDDARLIFDRHQTDFPLESDALAAVVAFFRRKSEPCQIRTHYVDYQANGRRRIVSTTSYDSSGNRLHV